MQSKILSTLLCLSLVASCAFADTTNGDNANARTSQTSTQAKQNNAQNSGLNLADGGGALTNLPDSETIKTYELGAVEITAKDAVDANPSVITINSKSIADKNANNVADAVRMVAGVLMHEATGQRGEPSVYIRGFSNTQSGLYLDGIPMMSIYDRQTDYGQYITQGISSIQISKGFVSPVYGMNTLGGAINLVSSKPQKEFEFSLGAKYLSGDEIRSALSVGTNQGLYYFGADVSYTDRLSYPLSNRYSGTTAQPKGSALNSYYTNQTIKLKAGIQPNENHEYSLNFINQKGRKGGLLSSGGGNWWEWPHYDKNTIYLLGNSYFTPDLSLNTRLYYDTFDNELNMYGRATNGQKPTTALSASSISIYDDDTLGAILTLAYDIYEGANVKVGANLKKDHHFEKDGVGVKGADLSELTTSIFAQYAQRISNFRFVIAGSYDRLDSLNVSVISNGAENTDKTKIKGDFSLQGIFYYDISEGQNVHLSVGKKENMPSLKDRYSSKWGDYATNSNLKPESALNYELGYDLNLAKTAVNVAVFYNDMTDMFYDELIFENRCTNYASAGSGRNAKPANACYQRVNADKGYTYGGEVSVEQGFFDGNALVLGANYSYIQQKAQGVAVDSLGRTKITDYPNHIFNAKVAVKPSPKLEFIGFSTLESARYYTSSTGGYVKNNNYFTLDLSANYEFDKNFVVSAGVLNFTDRDNYTNSNLPSTAFHYAGRRYVVGFDYKY